MTAADIRYGRRGGRWLPRPAAPAPAQAAPRRVVDTRLRAHPQTIARERRHQERAGRPPCPADDHRSPDPCTCVPDPDVLADVWAGRARMAAARSTAGAPLDDIDRQALDLQETTP